MNIQVIARIQSPEEHLLSIMCSVGLPAAALYGAPPSSCVMQVRSVVAVADKCGFARGEE